ncbi:MAG: molybdenum cofactor biosynthesis protein MoaB [Deltaproteobacteria bacterium]|jgi:molybdenum cofactor biosynthesis protein B|nr:molybdenum cofactor biosynthesis protein MoaB [Deltaproteobacteria bacterium]
MAHHEHKRSAPSAIPCAIVTVSDTRTEETDTSGAAIRERLLAAGHEVVHYAIVPDEPERIRAVIAEVRTAARARVVIVNGGTGISRRDRTYEAVAAMLDKTLDGFGELFRFLSYQDIGSAAMLSRAIAGLSGELVIFSVPGSSGAVKLAMDKLIVPELGHVVGESAKG